MASNLPVLSDHFLVQYILGKLVNQVTGCELVEDANIDEMEEYPYVTFTWIEPEKETTTDWLGEQRQYVCHLQIDVHATKPLEAQELAERIFVALHEDAFRRLFKQANIVPQEITNTSNRTTMIGINYDQDYGFDCSFLVNRGQEFKEKDLDWSVDQETITSITANNLLTQKGVNAFKKEEENG